MTVLPSLSAMTIATLDGVPTDIDAGFVLSIATIKSWSPSRTMSFTTEKVLHCVALSGIIPGKSTTPSKSVMSFSSVMEGVV